MLTTIDNNHINVLHYLPKQYIYGYLISRLINSEATIQNMILQNTYLLLIWGDVKERKKKKILLILTTTMYLPQTDY